MINLNLRPENMKYSLNDKMICSSCLGIEINQLISCMQDLLLMFFSHISLYRKNVYSMETRDKIQFKIRNIV